MVTVTTSSASSSVSVNGLSTGIDTTALINAIVAQKGTTVARLKAQQTLNNQKTTALTNIRTELGTLVTSMAALQDRLNGRVVASTDSNNTYVTATATGGVSGNYDITVGTVATRGRVSAKLDTNGNTLNLAVASPSDSVNSSVFTTGTPATFAVQGTDGKVYKIALDDNSNTLNGLRDKINAVAGSSVTASVVNMGKGAKPYQLVLTAKDTGTGSTLGKVSIADITTNDGLSTANNLGIDAGIVNNLTTPTTLSGGLTSVLNGATATDATFTLNGISLTRSTNVVKDAVDGMTFTLKQGGQAGTTTLSVAPDTTGATAALQDFITKFNTLVKDYKAASTSTKNADGSVAQGPLANDATTRTMMSNLRAALAGASAGLPGTSTYKTLASLGVSNKADGSLYLNDYTFQQAMKGDLASVQNLFTFSGTSDNSAVSVLGGGPNTATGSVDVVITGTSGAYVGTLAPHNGVPSDPIPVVNGTLSGTGAYAGLNLSVTGAGIATLTLSRGAGQAASDFLQTFTGTTGSIATLLTTITNQNANLLTQISQGQSRLDQETASLKLKFAQMESTVGQMRSSSSSLFGA